MADFIKLHAITATAAALNLLTGGAAHTQAQWNAGVRTQPSPISPAVLAAATNALVPALGTRGQQYHAFTIPDQRGASGTVYTNDTDSTIMVMATLRGSGWMEVRSSPASPWIFLFNIGITFDHAFYSWAIPPGAQYRFTGSMLGSSDGNTRWTEFR